MSEINTLKTVLVENKHDKFNYGLAILRIWMCFEVVLDHFKNWNGATAESLSWPFRMLLRYGEIAVPVFMLSSFVLTDMAKLSSDGERIKKRFYRLLVPHFFWAFAYFAIYKLLDVTTGLNLEIGIKDLLWQLTFGHSINQTEWFQIDLIVITAVFILGFKLFKKKAIIFTIGMGYLALFLQYSGINGALFDNMQYPFNTGYITYPVGRIMEMVPYTVLGILICKYSLLKRIEKHKCVVIPFSVLILYFMFNFSVFTGVGRSYGYSGMYYIVMGTVSVALFYALPLRAIPKICKKVIYFVARYNMSVYFMHRLVAAIIYNTQFNSLFGMRQGSIHDCIIIYKS